jgi:hypothetical protein
MEVETVAQEGKSGGRKEGFQNPLTHEGAAPDARDSIERADDKVRILQPNGKPVPRWRQGRREGFLAASEAYPRSRRRNWFFRG